VVSISPKIISNILAMKASKNELKGLGMYGTSRVAGLYYPLITVVHYFNIIINTKDRLQRI
jgi:hypothetical protein